MTQQAQEEQQEEQVTMDFEDKPVDKIYLVVVWRMFAQKLPQEEKAMSVRMDNMEPMLQEDGKTFVVIADNPSVRNDLERMRPKIETFMRLNLQNKTLTMDTRLREITDKKRVYSRKELLTMMLEQSEALRKLRDEFELELA